MIVITKEYRIKKTGCKAGASKRKGRVVNISKPKRKQKINERKKKDRKGSGLGTRIPILYHHVSLDSIDADLNVRLRRDISFIGAMDYSRPKRSYAEVVSGSGKCSIYLTKLVLVQFLYIIYIYTKCSNQGKSEWPVTRFIPRGLPFFYFSPFRFVLSQQF